VPIWRKFGQADRRFRAVLGVIQGHGKAIKIAMIAMNYHQLYQSERNVALPHLKRFLLSSLADKTC
jgi:hypothetical protein